MVLILHRLWIWVVDALKVLALLEDCARLGHSVHQGNKHQETEEPNLPVVPEVNASSLVNDIEEKQYKKALEHHFELSGEESLFIALNPISIQVKLPKLIAMHKADILARLESHAHVVPINQTGVAFFSHLYLVFVLHSLVKVREWE
jgi:hypothetical protein